MTLTTGIVLIVTLIIAFAGMLGVVYLLLMKFINHQQSIQQAEWKDRKRKDYIPVQMQAYERLILLLERINPERLVFRATKPGMSARLLQSEINKLVREEFDHNLTQQLYISAEAWEAVKAAKEELGGILNAAAERVHKDADAMEFSRAILEVSASLKTLPSEAAIAILKREFKKRMVD